MSLKKDIQNMLMETSDDIDSIVDIITENDFWFKDDVRLRMFIDHLGKKIYNDVRRTWNSEEYFNKFR